MQGQSLLPPEFYTFVKMAAAGGLLATGGLVVGLEYKWFKKVLGEEGAKNKRLLFVVGNIPLVFILVFIFLLLF